MNAYLVHITLPETFTADFRALLPLQVKMVNHLLDEHVILSSAMDMDRDNVWLTIRAKSEKDVMDILSTFPIIRDVKVHIHELAFYDTPPVDLPELIMN